MWQHEKLYCLKKPSDLGVSAPVKRPRNASAETRGQREVARVEDQRSEGQRVPESKSRGPRPAESGSELEDK